MFLFVQNSYASIIPKIPELLLSKDAEVDSQTVEVFSYTLHSRTSDYDYNLSFIIRNFRSLNRFTGFGLPSQVDFTTITLRRLKREVAVR